MRSTKSLRNWYKLINKKFFDNILPDNVCIRFDNDIDDFEEEGCAERYFGWLLPGTGQHRWLIVISRAKNPGLTAILNTLAHEMCHIATGNRDAHGKAFSDWHEKLVAKGLFRKSAVRKGITLF